MYRIETGKPFLIFFKVPLRSYFKENLILLSICFVYTHNDLKKKGMSFNLNVEIDVYTFSFFLFTRL